MTNHTKIMAIVPARGGSKGVPLKNILPVAGYPLIAYSIAAAKLSSRIDRVVVSTDSQQIAETSRNYGAEVPFMRPASLADDLSPDRDFVIHALGWLEENEGVVPDYLVHLRPTTPIRDTVLVDDAIDIIVADPEATSLRSAYELPESPFKWVMRDEHGHLYPFDPDDPRPGYSNLPRQLFPTVYKPDGYVDVLRSSFVQTADDIHGDRVIGYITPICVEVDSKEDFELIEFLLERKGSLLLDYLHKHYPLSEV